jgi:predicted Zn finger-like uncharacterized protein
MLIVCPSCTSRYEIDPAKLGPDGRKVRCPSCAFEWHAHGAGTPMAQASTKGDDKPSMRPDQTAQDFVAEEWARAAASDRAVDEALAREAAVAEASDGPVPEADVSRDEDEREPDTGPAPTAARSKWGGKKAARPRRVNLSFLKWRPRNPFRWRLPWPAGFLAAMVSPGSIVIAGLIVLSAIVIQRRAVVQTMPQMATLFDMIGLPVNLRGLEFERVQTELLEDAQGRYLIVQGEIRNVAGNAVPLPPIEIVIQDGGVKSLYTWTTEPPKSALGRGDTAAFRTRLASPPLGGVNIAVRFASGGKSALN